MTNFRVFLLICSMLTAVSVVMASTPDDEFVNKNLQQANLLTEQKLTVTGTIKDAVTGETLPGVTIVVKGTSTGTISDANGKFSVAVTDRTTVLIFSFVGYTTQEITALIGTSMNVSLSPLITQITDVVVVGYGTQKKESVVGAITQINNAGLMKSGSSLIAGAIAGKLSGVLTIQQTGEPGSNNAEILIRGLSSWNGSQPLILVDGVERNFVNMDPNEINTVSVLKDASSTAVFGAKGANGVIIVTTKRGSLGKPKMDFSVSYGMSRPARYSDFIDSYTTMSMENVAFMNEQSFTKLWSKKILEEYRNPSTPLNALRYPNVDWFDELTYSFAPTVNANFNLQGGTKNIKYFCSFGYFYEGSLFKQYNKGYDDTRYKYNKFNYRANVDFTLSKTTQLSLNLGGDISLKNQPSNEPWVALFVGSPSRFPVNFPPWVLEQVPDPDYPNDTGMRLAASAGQRGGNPYATLNNGSFNNYLGSELFTDLIFDQKLDVILKGLSFKGKASLSTYYNHLALSTNYSLPQYRLDYDNIGKPGVNPWFRTGQGTEVFTQPQLALNVGGLQNDYSTQLYYEMSLNYSNSFGKHNVTGLALLNRQQKNITLQFPYYNEALAGRVTYDYLRKYLLEVNVGYSGSERFAPKNRFGFFPSGALGWVISEENFFKNTVPWISKLKLRYSDGLVGSDIAANRWLYLSSFYKDSGGYIQEDNAANVDAQWEEAHKRDLGLELGVFKNAFTLSIDLFDEQRSKMLLLPQTVTMMVGSSFKDLNIGKMKKHGIEVEAEYNKMTSANLNYFIKGIFAFNEDRILSKDDPVYAPDYSKSAGKSLGAQLEGSSQTGSGYYTSVDDIHYNPTPLDLIKLYVGEMKVFDYNADGTISSADKYPVKGSYYPPITYSLSSGFSYKGFDFSFMFQGNVGKYVLFVNQWACEFYNANERVHISQLDYWTPNNQDATHSTLHYDPDPGVGTFNGYVEGQYWRNADYLRLKEVYAGYTFKSVSLKRLLGISNLNVYVTGINLLTITSLIEGDPEAKTFDSGFYPQMSNYRLGLKIAF